MVTSHSRQASLKFLKNHFKKKQSAHTQITQLDFRLSLIFGNMKSCLHLISSQYKLVWPLSQSSPHSSFREIDYPLVSAQITMEKLREADSKSKLLFVAFLITIS